MTDPTGGRGALDWLGIADRCQAACTSKEWLEASQSAALWQHWTFHMDGTRVYDPYYHGWRENPSRMPHHGQRANLLRLTDLPRLSPMLLARLQRHTTCVVMDFHQWAFADFVEAESPINRAWRVFSGLDFPRLQRVQFSFDIRGNPQNFDFGDAALPLPPQQSLSAFPFARNFAPLLAAKTLVVDRLPGLGQPLWGSRDKVTEPYHLSLEGILRMFKAVENLSMLDAFDSPIGAARYGEEREQRPALSHVSQLVGVDLLQQFTSVGWICWGALKVQMQQPASMNNLVSLGISIDAGTGELFEEMFKGLQRFAPSLEFLAIEADRLDATCWPIGYEDFEEVPTTVRHLVLGFDPAHFRADLDPNILCENLLDSCTLHMQAAENPPRGKTWADVWKRPPPYSEDPEAALRPPPRPHRGWQTVSWSVDLRDQFIPPDSFFSSRGRLSADELAERRRKREEEDY